MKRSFALSLALVLLVACGETAAGGAAKPSMPATVRPVSGTGLAEVKLTPEARSRLGLETVPLEAIRAIRHRLLAGDVVVALGDASDGATRATSIYSLVPPRNASELERVSELQLAADGVVEAAWITREAARETFERAEGVLESGGGSRRSVDDARAQLALAEAALRIARRRRSLLGTPVFDAVGAGRVWVRVEVYGGETQRLDLEAPAGFRPLGAPSGGPDGWLRPLRVPLSAATASATIDLFYEPTEAGAGLRPGERVVVLVPLREQADALRAPLSAVVRDAQGGAWVYEEAASNAFVRRRVEVRDTQGGWATLSAGPAAGTQIVSAGASELFGVELGFAK